MTENTSRRKRHAALSGLLLFLAGAVILMGIITAEALYPGYSTSQQAISDLGASEPPESVIVQPSATIFNATMMVSGLLILAGTVFVISSFRARGFPVLLVLLGAGALGVGIFPGNYGSLHAILALITSSRGAYRPCFRSP